MDRDFTSTYEPTTGRWVVRYQGQRIGVANTAAGTFELRRNHIRALMDSEGWRVRRVITRSHTGEGCRTRATLGDVRDDCMSLRELRALVRDTYRAYGHPWEDAPEPSRIGHSEAFRWTFEEGHDGHRITEMIIAQRV